MARFALVEQPQATPAPSAPMVLLREVASRLQARVKQTTQAINRLHNLLARTFPELATLTEDISTGWVLRLLDKYPTAERIAQAHRNSLEKIPYLSSDQAEAVHRSAKHSVATVRGPVAEALVRDLVAQVGHCQKAEKEIRRLLSSAFADLPSTPHIQVLTIPGIGAATAAVLIAKIVDIDRFETPGKLVNYFGIFPEENRSGVDKQGRPLPSGTLPMCRKGNDLVRSYLWNAARTAIRFNPAIRALYRRLKAKGKRGDVAIGHCMRKLLHLVFAVWKSDRPFDPQHFPWEASSEGDSSAAPPDVPNADGAPPAAERCVGHERNSPATEGVATALANVRSAPSSIEPQPPPTAAQRPKVDLASLRQQVTMEQAFEHLGLLSQLRGQGQERRDPCPLHAHLTDPERTFSVHLGKGAFPCFHARCAAKGNALDLWAAVHHRQRYEAALRLADTFGLLRNTEEEPVKRTRPVRAEGGSAMGNGPTQRK
jgi:transposase